MHGIYSSTDVANLILKTTGTALMDKKKLHKLLYYMQGWTLAALGRPAFANDLQAWVDGPVSVGMRRDTHYATCFEVANRPLSNPLAPQDRDLLALMYLIAPFYAQQQTQALVDSTHAEAPWLDARGGLPPPPDAHSSAPINDDALYSYFSQHARILGMTPADVAMFGPESFITEYKGEEFPDADSPLSQSANLITF
ncbi:DUF4065 domain-containing protein [Corynebacterium diphtheriae bv. gravis]|nr:DUF4065 domain-containing protein [Corynebacterium diphtheriae bv. gravis]